MTVSEYIAALQNLLKYPFKTPDPCDGLIMGDGSQEIQKIAFTMFATPNVIRDAAAWGARLIVTHECTFYDGHDKPNVVPDLVERKRKLINDLGLAIYRFHDHAHHMTPDIICEGELEKIALPGEFLGLDKFGINRFVLRDELTAMQLAEILEERLGIRRVRIVGCVDRPGRRIGCCFGTPGHVADELAENDFILTGEMSEWGPGEIVRDYAEFGENKAVLVMTHIGSEREGMRLLAERMAGYNSTETKYFECGEVYSYTDDKK